MMNRGLGSMFYGRRPVQYMQFGGLSGWGEMAAAGPVGGSAAVGGGSASKGGMSGKGGTGAGVGATSGGGSASKGGMSGKGGSGAGAGFADRDRDDRQSDLQRAIADSYAAEAMANAALASAAQYSGGGGGSGYSFGSTPVGGGMPSAAAPSISAGLSQPAYAGVSPVVSSAPSAPSGTSVSQAAALPVETLLGGTTAAGQIAVPPPRPTEPGFFQGLGSALMSLPGAIMNDIAMGWTLATQGEDAFIEKYGADALADYRQRTAETIARNEAEQAANDKDDVFEACPEGYERDPVTQMCVPVPVKLEEEEEEETTTTTGPTPGSGETIQEVIDRITVGPSVTTTVLPATTGNVLPNVDFFGVQRGPRRMADGGAVDYRAAARAEAEKFGLRPDMFERMILRESNFDPMARSRKGALGLAQVMPATARDPGFGVAPLMNPLDPNESLRFGAEYLSALLREFGGDEERALAAYNAGVGRVRAAGGVPDIAETRDYVDFILRGRGPVEAPPPRPADLGKKAGPSKAAVSRAVAALTPERRASVPVPPMPSRPSMSREERMSQLQGGMGGGDSLSRAVDSVLSSLMR